MLLLSLFIAETFEEPLSEEVVEPPPVGLVLAGGLLVDSEGERTADVLIVDGLIHAIGQDLDGAEVLELDGAIVTPGLIDSHVHTTLMPGEWLNHEQDWDALRAASMRAYVAAGVTTVLDAVAYPESLDEVLALEVRPEVLALGMPAALPGSYAPAVLPNWPTVTDVASLNAHLDREAARDIVGLKVLQEHGMVRDTWPVLDGEMAEALVVGAKERGLPLYVHAMSGDEALEALELNPHALMHTPLKPSIEAATALGASDVWVVTTMDITDSALIEVEPARVEEALFQLLVPEALRLATQDPELQRASRIAMGDVALPAAPHWLTKRPVGPKILGKVAASHQESVRLLRESGVKLVMGSDAPGWPVILNGVHGYSSIREMELLEAIGMTPLEALDAATSRATEMLGLQDRGRIEVGARADLVVHRQDPRTSTSAWRELSLVVLGGEARTPAEWLAH